jgi:hypothetical protein
MDKPVEAVQAFIVSNGANISSGSTARQVGRSIPGRPEDELSGLRSGQTGLEAAKEMQ